MPGPFCAVEGVNPTLLGLPLHPPAPDVLEVLLVERKPRAINAMNHVPIADELPDDYRMVVVVVAVMPIWLRKCAGRKERKQNKY